MNTTRTFEITNTRSGQSLGQYPGATGADAIAAMLRDAGHDGPADEALRAVEVAPATRYRVEVRGTFAGTTGGWRPACSGTENQTGASDEEASTFDALDDAQGYEDHLRSLCEDGDDARFQVVEVVEVAGA